jgi:hypothetical protein
MSLWEMQGPSQESFVDNPLGRPGLVDAAFAASGMGKASKRLITSELSRRDAPTVPASRTRLDNL